MLLARQQSSLKANGLIRPITLADNPAIANVIRQVSAQYGLTADKGYGVSDPSLDCMMQTYDKTNAQYWVIERQQCVVGGAGIAPLSGHVDTAELQKMYFSDSIRGLKMAQPLFDTCHTFAKAAGYTRIYLETTAVLVEALAFYQRLGFRPCAHLGDTGHDACEIAMSLTL
ncbi:GNAT family N-acetyltransferase [Shewanella intestini]|uniref:GNAT family N-acetyltransferase n=2 Tax=Shewanellaceae TaxID=267890 RepID=A0ABS5I2E9_9GAMM|nr:GNAT family N-acetyltransferase [Shewanella intestini]MRG36466.1 GNAT family N-acetyltransferase [Shewanella sp. XMDDZSB0408]